MKYLIPLMLTVSILMSDSQLKNHNVNFIPKPGQVHLNNPTREEGILIVDFDETPTGENLKSTIESIYDGVVDITSDFEEMNLSGREAVFVLLGIYPNNTVILPEGSTPFLDYLNSGGNLYMEGGDMWYYDPQYQGGYDFGPEFGITAELDGTGDLGQVVGYNFLEGNTWVYSGENSWIDHIVPSNEDAFNVFSNDGIGYHCGIAQDNGSYKTIGTSFEITGLGGESSLEDAVAGILEFFDVGEGGGPEYQIDFSTTITATDDLSSLPFELTFGTSPEATVGYDDGLDEFAPPPPPPPAWDAALFNMEVNDRFFADFRPTTPESGMTEWAIDFQADQGSEEYILNWDASTLGEGNFTLSDPFGGVSFSINMRETDSYSIPVSYNRVVITHSYITLDFSTAIIATNSWSPEQFSLMIGTSENATIGYDDGLDEYAPPSPPPPAWDVALYNLELMDRFYADYRPTTSMEGSTTWAIDLMVETPYSVNTLSWDPNSLGEGNFMLTDAFGGVMFSYDMRTIESVELDQSISRVLIVHSYFSFDFLTVISATDNLGSDPFTLSIGTIQNATDDYDDGLDVYAPPAPPPPAWDAALFNQIVSDRFYTDIRPTTSDQGSTEWAVDFQGLDGTTDFILSWDPNSLGEGNFTLTDAFGGSLLSVNMRETNQAVIPHMFNRVIITQSMFSLDFGVTLSATDNVNFPVDLLFGTSPDATDGYDEGMDVYAPPAPPPPAWDAALFNPIVSDRFYTDIRPTTPEDGSSEWAIDFQAGDGSEEISLSWNAESLGEGNFTLTDAFGGLFFSVNMSSTDSYSFPIMHNRVFITHSYSSSMEISYMAGWNMVGLPLSVENNAYDAVFPYGEPNTLYAYNNGYSLEQNLEIGVGYLLRMSEENTTTISGTPVNSVTVSLNPDWNIISGISSSIDIDIINNEDIIVPSTTYGYGPNGYYGPDAIEPGYGYWIRAYYEGELTLNAGRTVSHKKNETVHLPLNKLEFVLPNGSSQTLYFGGSYSDTEQLQFSLPPTFDGMEFDVRFEGNSRHSEHGNSIQMVKPEGSLSVQYTISNKNQLNGWILDIDGQQIELVHSGEITLNESPSKILLMKSSDIPTSFSLGVNYPNPFNGSTIIPFELRENAFITLNIFDISGKLITELISQEKPTGTYQMEWNGTDSKGIHVPTGMYIYSIESNGKKLFHKLLYLK